MGGFNGLAAGDLNGDGALNLVTARYTTSQGDSSGFEVLFAEREVAPSPVVPEASTLLLLEGSATGLAAYAALQIRARRRR